MKRSASRIRWRAVAAEAGAARSNVAPVGTCDGVVVPAEAPGRARGSGVPRLMLAAALVIGLGAACSGPGERADLVFINGSDPGLIDPVHVTDQAGMRVASAIFEGLTRLDEHGHAVPGLASSWEVSEDGLTYTFHLREEARWSDGRPLDAGDFVRAWERALRPATGSSYANVMYPILNAEAYHSGELDDFGEVGVREIDGRTLEVRLANPTPYFIDLCSFITLAPTPVDLVEEHGGRWTMPQHVVGTGAYKLVEWKLDDRFQLVRNPHYWDADNVALGSIDVLSVSDPNTAINYFLTGTADLITDKAMIPAALVDVLADQPWFHSGPMLGTYFIRFNVTRPPFDDLRVRQAFALAVERDRITDKITRLGELEALSFTPPGTGGYTPPEGPGFDPERARELLAEAGFPGGRGFPSVEYLYSSNPMERNIAIELQAMWREVLGVTVDLRNQEWRVYLSSMRQLEYSFCRSSWIGDYNDPSTFLDMFISGGGNNRTGWESAEYDGLVAAAAAEVDQARRHEIFRRAEQMLLAEQVVVPLYFYVGVQFYDPERLGGVSANLIDEHPFRTMYWKNGDGR